MPELERECRSCGKVKPISSFRKRYGVHAHLREWSCGYCRSLAFKAGNPERWREIKTANDQKRRARQAGITVEQLEERRKGKADRALASLLTPKKPISLRCPVLRRHPRYDRETAAKAAAKSRRRYDHNAEHERARVRRWKAAHPETVNEQRRRRRERLRQVVDDLTEGQWQRLLQAFASRCAYCGRQPDRLTRDRVVPLCAGGARTVSNIVPACRSCNSSKGSRLLRVWPRPGLAMSAFGYSGWSFVGERVPSV